MLFYTVGQSRIFLCMLYAGLLIGLYLSADNALRRLFEAGRILSVCMDLLFGAAAAAVVILALIIAADGELRLYALMGALCGYLLYVATLEPVLIRLLRCLKRPVVLCIDFLSRSMLIKKFFR